MDVEPSGEVLLLIFVYPLHNFSKFLWFTSLYFWTLSTWQRKLFPVCITASWLHQFTQQIYSCQVFCDLAALHQGFERLCDRVTSWNLWPSATLLAFPPFLSLSHSSPLLPNPNQLTNPIFFFHRLFSHHPGPSGSHLLPNDFKKQFFQTHPVLSPEEHLANHGLFQSNHSYVFFFLSFQSVILFPVSILI